MKRVIDRYQTCDMGDGFGHYEFEKLTTLKEFLEGYKTTSKTWGVITIVEKDGAVLRKFDYDTHNSRQFYYYLSWQLNMFVKSANFRYCFMNEDVNIELQ
jgi:hypothetical protein